MTADVIEGLTAEELLSPACCRKVLAWYAENWDGSAMAKFDVLVLADEKLRKKNHEWGCPCGHCVPSKWTEVLYDLGEARDLRASGYPGEEWDAQARYDWGLDVLAYGERGRPAGKVHGARERVA